MKNQEKKAEQLYEQIKVGVALFETAGLNIDKNVSSSLAKQGLSLLAGASKAFLDEPDLCPPYRTFPPKKPRRNWWEVITNPLLDPDYQYQLNNAEVLGLIENLRGSVVSETLKNDLKGLAKIAFESVNI